MKQLWMALTFMLLTCCIFTGCSQTGIRFVNEEEHQQDLAKLKIYNMDKLNQLSRYGVNPNSDVSLLYYFTSDDSVKMNALAADLRDINHHVNSIHQSANDKTLWVLSANSSEVKMDSSSLNKWATGLCNMGYKHDCAMQGWNPVSE